MLRDLIDAPRCLVANAGTAALLLVIAGCNSGPQVEYAPVQGRVELDTKPLAGAIVTFYPVVDGIEGLPHARTTTDDDGNYTLTDDEGKGTVVVGKNRVVVNFPLPQRGGDLDDTPAPTIGPTIPIRYTVASQTPLIVEVKAGGMQTIALKLLTK